MESNQQLNIWKFQHVEQSRNIKFRKKKKIIPVLVLNCLNGAWRCSLETSAVSNFSRNEHKNKKYFECLQWEERLCSSWAIAFTSQVLLVYIILPLHEASTKKKNRHVLWASMSGGLVFHVCKLEENYTTSEQKYTSRKSLSKSSCACLGIKMCC